MLRRQGDRQRRPERLAEIDQSRGIHIASLQQVAVGGVRIGSETGLGRLPLVAAVPAVVEQEHLKPLALQRCGKWRTVRPIAGVAVENQDCVRGG